MKKLFIFLGVLFVGIWVFQNKLAEKAADIITGVRKEDPPCQVGGMTCAQIAQTVNFFRPEKYYQQAELVFNVQEEEGSIYREKESTVIKFPGGERVAHYQGHRWGKKGQITIFFPDQMQMTFDAKGNFVSQSYE